MVGAGDIEILKENANSMSPEIVSALQNVEIQSLATWSLLLVN